MACIKSAQRSALVAIAPDAPYLAAGTMSGAVDLSFSSSANLEIFKLDFQSDAPDLPLAVSIPSQDRFNRLSWSKPASSEEFSLGLLAGGLGDGSIGVWNPWTMISSQDQDAALVARLEKHTGPVRGLEFSTMAPNLLASGADEGEICIWDLAKPPEPNLFPPLKGVGSGAQTEVSFVSWNPKFQHILASTSYNGISVVWDLRQQKPITSFSDPNRRRCSVLQWNPDMSTQLIVASDDDSSPSLRVWDVRKTISPLKEFVGHTKGVIAMSWCPYDSSFLLTCAKDNRTICWDTHSGEIASELPASTNWNFDVHWYPKIPGVISASSFDVKIGIYNIEACGRYSGGEGSYGTVPARMRAPKWLKCPTGASFGFGGKFVSFRANPVVPNAPNTNSEVFVHELVTEHTLVSRSTEFESVIKNGEKASLRALCEKKSEESKSEEEKETWSFLKVMLDEEGAARTKLLDHLGFSVPESQTVDSTNDLVKILEDSLSVDNNSSTFPEARDSQFLVDNGDEFFNNPQPSSEDTLVSEESGSSNETEQIKKDEEQKIPEVPSDPSVDESIQRALVVGDYKAAVAQCAAANRMADALVIAHVGGPSLWESTRNLYLKNSVSSYLKIVSAMAGNDLMSFVNTWPLNSWKETLALLCTFANKDEWAVLCDTLASRLLASGNTLAATLCYIVAGNIDKTVEIWSLNLKSEDEGKTYVDLLQDLMEKTITLALATGQKRFSASLSKLVENYAELLASQGLLSTAMEYLKLLGSDGSSQELTILRDRIAFSAESAAADAFPSEQHTASYYGEDQLSSNSIDYQTQQPRSVSDQYGEGYQQQPFNPTYGSYAPVQQKPVQFQDYTSTSSAAPYQSNSVPSFQPAPIRQMFVPSPAQHAPPRQPSFGQQPATQLTATSFVPSDKGVLKNAEQYQQPTTLGSQLYPGLTNPTFQAPVPPGAAAPRSSAPPMTGSIPGHKFPQAAATNPSSGFMPMANQGFIPRAGMGPMSTTQPSSPTQAPAQQLPAPAPAAPPPTVPTADTSKVSAELRPVILTLTRLFDETSRALGGPQANPSKKREIDDNSKKIGALFVKLNGGDISPSVASKLVQLCLALDNGDFASALQLQVSLTTSDWDECNFWLVALKRMIKTRSSLRL
ncbi:protein transport protein SEC31 homolog B-like isoform X3 [Carex rostrata]